MLKSLFLFSELAVIAGKSENIIGFSTSEKARISLGAGTRTQKSSPHKCLIQILII